MSDWYPEPEKFLECERETLKFLKDTSTVAIHFTELNNEAHKLYYAIKKDQKKIRPFCFESQITVNLSTKEIKNQKGIANISTYIEKEKEKFKKISYNLDIIDKSQTPSKILRKFHFDYDPPDTQHRFPHPVIHLQYGGKLSEKLKPLGLTSDHLDIGMEKPRLCYFPMSLALLINLVLIDFPDENSIKLCGTSEWRNLIRKNEDIVLKPFFANCHRFFCNRPNNRLFVNDFYYGNCTK